MFIDHAEILVRSGKGGDGMMHFHREKFVPRGGPDGGDGGRGADVILEVRQGLNTLQAFRHVTRYLGDNGRNGGPNNMSGKSAENLIIPVPPGTVVYDAITGELIGDLTKAGERLTLCKGGRGGRGNQHFATSRNQAPRTAEKGEPSEEKRIKLELKLIADIGMIGVPNAGKSTLLSVLTNAKPKIAPYPFTTLEPNLGVAEIDDEHSVVLADIPGLIEGASHGAGLGHDFLRHIQRTRVLVHLLDGLSDDPVADFSQINSELALFDPNLAGKPQVVVLNKIDQPEVQERLADIKKKFKKQKVEFMTVSALARTNTRELLLKAVEKLSGLPALEDIPAPMPVYRPKEDMGEFTIKPEGENKWRLSGAAIERAAAMTYWEHSGSVRRFQKIMETLGVDDALRKAGVKDGDTVAIADFELDWQE
ncbi:MAG: GTPase ObgE [Chloroflexi bacterium]|nr:GTPase ObgE [Chloroflexota bacterium]MBI1855683.1 GTPase ObgE [Chloroflexota bacterium]MBI3338746.1 GTPase ObgE [Chloroflexota bacterium]